MDKLENLGFGDWIRARVDAEMAAAHEVARVVSVHKASYVVTRGDREVFAELSGHLFHSTESPLDLPTTGDWVYADFHDDDTHAIIHGVLPRKSLLKRKTAGRVVDFQLIAANIDVAFIIQAVDADLNLRRLERYLVMVNESRITPVILLSKCDLVDEEALEAIEEQVLRVAPQAMVRAFSNLNGENIPTIMNSLVPGFTYCLLGSSGVGKTSLLNSMIGNEQFETRAVREKDSKGKHTTTRRELIQLDNGALLIDTPGMRELGSLSVDAGLDETFSEIVELARHCKFNDCSHAGESGCAVLAAIAEGELSEKRFKNYRKIKNESAFHDMSYADRKKKDKAFGKMIKSAVNHKKRH
jgi:ribosome biogenesis GTPase